MNSDEIITRDPEVLGGIPVFKGTRVPVETLISHLKTGISLDEFLADFPSVRRVQAEAVLELVKNDCRGVQGKRSGA